MMSWWHHSVMLNNTATNTVTCPDFKFGLGIKQHQILALKSRTWTSLLFLYGSIAGGIKWHWSVWQPLTSLQQFLNPRIHLLPEINQLVLCQNTSWMFGALCGLLPLLWLFPPPLHHHVFVVMTESLHHSHKDVGCFNKVTQKGFCLKHFFEISEESDKNVTVLRVVEDIALHHFCVFLENFVFWDDHLLNVEKQFFVCLKCIVESVRTRMWGTGGGRGWEEKEKY